MWPIRECEWDTPGGFTKSGPGDSQNRVPRFFFLSVSYGPEPRVGGAAPGDWRWTGVPPLFAARSGRGGIAQFTIAQHPLGGRSRLNCPCGKARTMGIAHRCYADTLERDSTKWRHEVLVLAGSAAVNWNTRHDPRAGFGAHQALRAPKIAIQVRTSQPRWMPPLVACQNTPAGPRGRLLPMFRAKRHSGRMGQSVRCEGVLALAVMSAGSRSVAAAKLALWQRRRRSVARQQLREPHQRKI